MDSCKLMADFTPVKPKRGFAAMDPATHRAHSRTGGRTVQERGVGHRFRENDAATKRAARDGGLARHAGKPK